MDLIPSICTYIKGGAAKMQMKACDGKSHPMILLLMEAMLCCWRVHLQCLSSFFYGLDGSHHLYFTSMELFSTSPLSSNFPLYFLMLLSFLLRLNILIWEMQIEQICLLMASDVVQVHCPCSS